MQDRKVRDSKENQDGMSNLPQEMPSIPFSPSRRADRVGFWSAVRHQPQGSYCSAAERSACPLGTWGGGRGGQGTPTPARQPWQHRSEPGTARDLLTAASLGCLCLPFLRKQTWEMSVRGLIRIIRRVCCRYDMRCWSRASLNWVPGPLTKTASRIRAQRSAGASASEVSASPLLCPPVPAVPADPTLLSLLPFSESCQPAL